MRAVSTQTAYLRGASFTHYSHNSHNSHYSHFMRRPHELSGMTGYTKLALQYRQGMTAFPPPPAGQGGVMMLVRNRPPAISRAPVCPASLLNNTLY